MTRGLGGQSPANVSNYLKGMDFPANKQDLVECARQNGAEDEVVNKIEQFDDRRFNTMADVMKAYGDSNSGDSDRGRSDSGNNTGSRTQH